MPYGVGAGDGELSLVSSDYRMSLAFLPFEHLP